MNTEQNDFSGRAPSGTIRSIFFWVSGWDVSQLFGWKSPPYGRAAFNFCSPETAHMRSTDPKIIFSLVSATHQLLSNNKARAIFI